jgi:PAS domain S-box-containing protein
LESEEKFRRLFETAFDGIILLSNFVIHDCNNQAAVMFGADQHRMIGSDFTLLSPDQQPDGAQTREKAYVLLEKALEEGGVIVTWKFKRWDGTVFDADMSISAFEIGGNIYYQAIIRDITDRIMAKQELEQRNADISAAYEKLIASGEELKVRLEELHRSRDAQRKSEKV